MIGPSEMYAKKFHDSKLLIPGRHIQLNHTIGQGYVSIYKSIYIIYSGNSK